MSDTAYRAVAGATVEVLNGPQAGMSAISNAQGAFSLTGAFDSSTLFRATKDGYLTATNPINGPATTKSIFFLLALVAAPADIAGDYTLTVNADSACADRLPAEVRTRTYTAKIAPNSFPSRPPNTSFIATLGGAKLDEHFNLLPIFVAGDYLDFDLSDNLFLEEVGEKRYLAVGGTGSASVDPGAASTISVSFLGIFEYCELGSKYDGKGYVCASAGTVARAQCDSTNHHMIFTRR